MSIEKEEKGTPRNNKIFDRFYYINRFKLLELIT
jgi:hypothetical protein